MGSKTLNWTNNSSIKPINDTIYFDDRDETFRLHRWPIESIVIDIILCALGFAGNSLVLLVLKQRKPKTRAPYEYLIANLCIADLVFQGTYLLLKYSSYYRCNFNKPAAGADFFEVFCSSKKIVVLPPLPFNQKSSKGGGNTT